MDYIPHFIICLIKRLLNPLKLEIITKDFIWNSKIRRSIIFKIFGSGPKTLCVDFQLLEVQRWWIHFLKCRSQDRRETLWSFAYLPMRKTKRVELYWICICLTLSRSESQRFLPLVFKRRSSIECSRVLPIMPLTGFRPWTIYLISWSLSYHIWETGHDHRFQRVLWELN